MISPAYRAKLPKGWSYPIGAEAIGEAFASVPRADQLRLCFYSRSVEPATEFRRRLMERCPYTLMQAKHTPKTKPGISGAHFMEEQGYYEEKWELTVYPVLSEWKPSAKQLLLDRGLPAIEDWLRSADRDDWSQRWHQLDLVFDPKELSLTPQTQQGV